MDVNLESIFERYEQLNFKLVPMAFKTPKIANQHENASSDKNQMMAWAKQFVQCDWSVSLGRSYKNGLIVIDVETKDGGVEAWTALNDQYGPFETLTARSGSGGLHIFFEEPKGYEWKQYVAKGIEIKRGDNTINVYPSIHPDTLQQYKWISKKGINPQPLPEVLRNLMIKDGKKGKASTKYRINHKYVEKLVDELRQYPLTYHEWTNAGMAIYNSYPDDIGLDLFIKLTQGVSYEEGDIERAQNKWDGFEQFDDGFTPGTLVHLIKEKGGTVPPADSKDVNSFHLQKHGEQVDAMKSDQSWIKNEEDGTYLTYNANFLVEYFNNKGLIFNQATLATPFAFLRKDQDDQWIVNVTNRNALRDQFAAYQFGEISVGKNGPIIKEVPAIEKWIKHSDRREYLGIDFNPNGVPEGFFNLWNGFPCKGYEGNGKSVEDIVMPFIETVIFESLCDRNQEAFDWLMNWQADVIQNPGKKSTTVPVHWGDQGTGKGLLYEGLWRKILARLFYKVMNPNSLKQNFNKHLEGRLMVFIDEATWSGDKKESAILKSLTGGEQIEVEEKFGSKYIINNFARYVIASNNPDPVAVEKSNRRYAMIKTSPKYAGKCSIFNPFFEQVNSGVLPNAFFTYLQNYKMDNAFNRFEIFETTAGVDAKLVTEGPVAVFWGNIIYEEPKPIFFEGDKLVRNHAYEFFKRWARDVGTWERQISAQKFWMKTEELCPALKSAPQSRIRIGNMQPRISEIGSEEFVIGFINTLKIPFPENVSPFELEYWEEGQGQPVDAVKFDVVETPKGMQ